MSWALGVVLLRLFGGNEAIECDDIRSTRLAGNLMSESPSTSFNLEADSDIRADHFVIRSNVIRLQEQDLREQPEQEPPAPVLARPAKPAAQARGRISSSHNAAISWRLVIN